MIPSVDTLSVNQFEFCARRGRHTFVTNDALYGIGNIAGLGFTRIFDVVVVAHGSGEFKVLLIN